MFSQFSLKLLQAPKEVVLMDILAEKIAKEIDIPK
jgi:hypothetical protein